MAVYHLAAPISNSYNSCSSYNRKRKLSMGSRSAFYVGFAGALNKTKSEEKKKKLSLFLGLIEVMYINTYTYIAWPPRHTAVGQFK